MGVILIFSLGNASDAFLLLRLGDLGVATFWIPLLWSALHIVKVVASLGGGIVSDRVGRRTMIGLGWVIYALVYAGFGHFDSRSAVIAIFLSYGVYFGLTEGVEKAWVADMVPATARGTAFGIYNAVLGGGSLIASLLFGLIWTRVSPHAAFTHWRRPCAPGHAPAGFAVVVQLSRADENVICPPPGVEKGVNCTHP